jgi:hypothetical protein
MSNLDKLMQMVTLEQLNNMVQQLNKTNSEAKDTEAKSKDVLSLPIVQKVIMAYEDELKSVKDDLSNCYKCVDNTSLLHQIFDRVDKYNLNLQRIETKLDNLTSLLETHTSNHLSNQNHNSFVEDKNQTKLTSFYGFNHYVNAIDLTEDEAEQFPEIKYIEIKIENVVEENVVEENVVEENVVEENVVEENVVEENVVEEEEVEKQNITLEIEEVAEDDVYVDHSSDEPIIKAAEEEVFEEEEDEEAAEDKIAIEDEEKEEEEEVVSDDKVKEKEEEEEEAVSEAEVATDVEDVEDVDEDEEVFEIEIDDITYFATDEENGILYEVDKDGEVGKKVGIIKDGEPIFS